MVTVTIIVAFFAGLVSFLSPCVLPIIPGFLAYLAGASTKPGEESPHSHREIFLNSILFVLGFSTVFSLLGVLLNTILESVAYDVQQWLARGGGVIIIFFGLYLAGLVHVGFLDRDYKFSAGKLHLKSRYATSFIFGAAFAAGWTPCVGAALGAILGLAASQPGSAFSLLFAYTIGLGVPFLIVGFFAGRARAVLQKLGPWLGIINKVFGVILIILGILVFTQQLSRIASFEFVNMLLKYFS